LIDYEITVIYHPDLEIDLSKAADKVQKIFAEAGGEIAKTDDWGKRKLAYPIDKQSHGIYLFYLLKLSPDKVRKIEEKLKITDEVIRYLIVRVDLRAIKKAEEAKAKKAKKLKAEDENDKIEEGESDGEKL
jgi:small subunit ribosomal protein S6